ncbi:MAG: hypothetical protein NTX22_12085 [Ignavibacteriales bacterium]|nr:hypothetical protein [Ignavibacteriales bacterium]
MKKKYFLNKEWKFSINPKEIDPTASSKQLKKYGQWFKATVPGTIHTDLLTNKLIPEPFYSDNETQLQWIGETDWIYKTIFDLPKEFDITKSVRLVFDGLDTVATIKLNDVELGSSNNMFRTFSYNVSTMLKLTGNVLEVDFSSAEKYAKELELKFGILPVALRSERVYIRKAQYSFGWDWGPAFITMGIWRQVYLIQDEECKIGNVLFSTKSIHNDFAEVEVKVELEYPANSILKIKTILDDGENTFEKISETADQKLIIENIEITNTKIWWPNEYGEQSLYHLTIQLLDKNNEVIDEEKRRVGIRTIELKLKKNGENVFQFIINGKPIFAKGANWIPADTFLPRVTEEKYNQLLLDAKNANMNIIRVWGGGIYEDDKFYEICDELGLMVWQDFMFACASYPEHQEFLENVSGEVKENIARLQHHPSIIIWCGNNENEWIWFQEHQKSYKKMSGYKIYNKLIPDILKELDSSRPYWQSTPFGFEENPNSSLSGNRHQWEIWSMWTDYKKVIYDTSLFVSEFGFQSPANFETFKKILPKKVRKIQSRIFEFHNKQVEGPERLFKFLSAHLPVKTEMNDFIYLTQLNHGFAMKECLEHWRFRFPETNGTIIWQLNDCWPVSSWALIDSELRTKLPYYFVKNAFAPQICGLIKRENEIDVTAINNSLTEFEGTVRLDLIHLPKGKIEELGTTEVKLKSLEKKIILTLPMVNSFEIGRTVLISTLFNNEKQILHRNVFIAQEWKYLLLPKVKIAMKKKKGELIISSNKPAFFVYLQSADFNFKENGFILLPGEEIKLEMEKGKGKKVSYKSLNQFLD